MLRKRAANSTALAAIGPRKKIRKMDEVLEGSSPSTQVRSTNLCVAVRCTSVCLSVALSSLEGLS